VLRRSRSSQCDGLPVAALLGASGHVAAAPPSSDIKSRRCMLPPDGAMVLPTISECRSATACIILKEPESSPFYAQVSGSNPCLYRKLDSAIMVMESSEDGRRYDAAYVKSEAALRIARELPLGGEWPRN
jgi:hypothetical protein